MKHWSSSQACGRFAQPLEIQCYSAVQDYYTRNQNISNGGKFGEKTNSTVHSLLLYYIHFSQHIVLFSLRKTSYRKLFHLNLNKYNGSATNSEETYLCIIETLFILTCRDCFEDLVRREIIFRIL